MSDLLAIPPGASWPRLMTGPHPDATGSYGPLLEKNSFDRDKTVLRWWQRLAMRRILEHRDDGSLIWLEWLLSTARQVGKSVSLRELAMWRIMAADLIGEVQEVTHLSSVMRNASAIQRPARSWAKVHKEEGWNAREMNGAQTVFAPDGSTWSIHSQTSVFGSSASLALVDEGWKIDPITVSDALEPTLTERRWGQLALVSTAHSRPTSLMVDRRLAALVDPTTLICEWSALPGCELGDVDEWKRASPQWSPVREQRIEKALTRALAANAPIGDQDPVAGFRSHWLNIWPTVAVKEMRVPGISLVPDGVWPTLAGDVEIVGPIAFSIEDLHGRGVAVAAAGIAADGKTVVEAYELADRRMAWAWVRGHAEPRPGSAVTIGAALSNDPEGRELGVPVTVATYPLIKAGLSRFRASASRRNITHTGSPVLAQQLDELRVVEGQAGLRVVSSSPWELVRCAAWSVLAAETRDVGMPHVW